MGSRHHQHAQKELQATRELLELAIEASGLGIWDWVPGEDRLTWSPQLQEIYGLKPGEFKSSLAHYQELIHPEDRESTRQTVRDAVEKKKPYEVIHRVLWSDGSVHWVQARGKPYFDQSGNLVRIAGTVMNIDQKISVDLALKQAIRARDEFISIASHELKTPISAMKLQTDILKRNAARTQNISEEQVQKLVSQCSRSLDNLTRLIDAMLDVSRIHTGRLGLNIEPTNLVELVHEISEKFRPQFAAAHIDFRLDAREEKPVGVDPQRLEQVLSNLYTNAIRYAPGASLETKVEAQPDSIEIEVRDHGPGISPDDQKRIFGRFERGAHPSKRPGLGLGLYIAKEIIEAHRGRLEVESEQGQGATFRVVLPR